MLQIWGYLILGGINMIRNEQQVIGLLIIIVIAMIVGMIFAWFIEEKSLIVHGLLQFQREIPSNYLQKEVIMEMIATFNPRMSLKERMGVCREIIRCAEQFALHPFLIAGVIAAESSFRTRAVSQRQAKGLMQITDMVSRMMGIENPYDIRQNIYAGTKYLHMLFSQFANEELVLAAYNAGPTRVARLKRVPNIKETLHYVKKVMVYQRQMCAQLMRQIHREFMKPLPMKVAWNMVPAPNQERLKDDIILSRKVLGLEWCETRQNLLLV